MEEANLEQAAEQQELVVDQLDYDIAYTCTSPDTWGFVINATNQGEEPIESTVAPHGGPDPDTEELNTDVIFLLNIDPGAEGSVAVSGLPEIAVYEWATDDTPLETINNSEVDFSQCPVDEVAPQPEEEPEPETEPQPEEAVASEPEDNHVAEEATEVPAEDVGETVAEVEQPAELPATGADMSSIALVGTIALIAGAQMARRTGKRV